MDATKEAELMNTVNDIGDDTDSILQMLRSVKEHHCHKEDTNMDSNLAAALLSQNNRNCNNNLWDNPLI